MHQSTSSTMSSELGEKKTLRRIEIALNKFNEIAVPYHVDLLLKHKANIQRFERLGELAAAHREHVNAGRTVQQLKALLYEIDGLRMQVRDEDLEEFARLTDKSRKSVLDAIQSYLDMEKPDMNKIKPYTEEWPAENETSPLEMSSIPPLQVQMDPHLEEAEIAKKEAYLRSWEELHTEFEDLNQLYQDFAAVVQSQGELVTQAETHVENTQHNVQEGAKQLAIASRLKAASYPMVGALIGGCMGGPIGLVAGLKLGGLAAIGGGLLGFTGGRFLKNKQITVIPEETSTDNSSNTAVTVQETNPITNISTACVSLIS